MTWSPWSFYTFRAFCRELSLQQFFNYGLSVPSLALVPIVVHCQVSALVSLSSLYSPVCPSNLRAAVCPVSSPLLRIQEKLNKSVQLVTHC